MTDDTLTPTKGQRLKDTLELLFRDLEQFDASPLCHPKTLQRMLGERYALLVADRLSPRDLAVEGLKRLTIHLALEALRQDDSRLVEGLVLIWHQYLEPILSGSARSISPVARVLAYCAQSSNLEHMWGEIEKASKISGQVIHRLPLFRDIIDNGQGYEHSAKKQRRTYANYIQRAFDLLARASELQVALEAERERPVVEVTTADQPAPELELPSEVAVTPTARSSRLDAVVAYLLERCHQLPSACGRTLPTACAIDRTIELLSVKGGPLCPLAPPESLNEVNRMSGVLVGVPGSGRTAFLYQVAYAWVSAWTYGQPLAIYIRAPEFLVYARNRRSIHEFTARQVLPNSSRDEVESLGKELEAYEQTYGVLWLVDEVDRLAEPDQAEVILQMAFSPAVLLAACPWEAERVAQQMYPADVGVFGLVDLSQAQQKELLTRLLALHPEAKVNQPIGYLAVLEVPYLAKLPLGIMAIFDQLVTHIADRVHVTGRALDEYFERAGLPRPQFVGDWWSLAPTVRALLVMTAVTGADILWVKGAELFTGRARFEEGAGWSAESKWELLWRTRLFEPHPHWDEAVRFFNWDILGYLIAKSAAASLFAHTRVAPCNFITPFTQAVFQFKLYAEDWQRASRCPFQ